MACHPPASRRDAIWVEFMGYGDVWGLGFIFLFSTNSLSLRDKAAMNKRIFKVLFSGPQALMQEPGDRWLVVVNSICVEA